MLQTEPTQTKLDVSTRATTTGGISYVTGVGLESERAIDHCLRRIFLLDTPSIVVAGALSLDIAYTYRTHTPACRPTADRLVDGVLIQKLEARKGALFFANTVWRGFDGGDSWMAVQG